VIARRFLIAGRVQGVGYRVFAETAAARRGVAGWVRNRDDGTVEVLAEGTPEAVEALKRDLLAGPRHADVAEIQETIEAPAGTFEGFHVIYGEELG